MRSITIGTFHSICLSFLQKHKAAALIDEFDALSIADELLAEQKAKLSARRFLQDVSRVKNGLSPESKDFPYSSSSFIANASKKRACWILMTFCWEALKEWEHADSRDKRPFTHLLVDEFQDVNHIQYQLIRSWSSAEKVFLS